MTARLPVALSALALVVGLPLALGGAASDPTQDAIRLALSSDPEAHADGVERLRTLGQDGLDAVLDARERAPRRATNERWERAIDDVAAQKDASWSGLFWHTDLGDARREAAERGVPIVSLRMLGDLRDTLSCANSRYFRAVLYTNPDVSERLREDFVLHWSSEREVPRITIDFGDGRVIESTITGNSAHLVLDAEGLPVDVIPGLFAPEAFLEALEDAGRLHDALAADPAHRSEMLVRHHTDARDAAVARVRTSRGAAPSWEVLGGPAPATLGDGSAVLSIDAIPLAVGKGVWEAPVARSLTPLEPARPPLAPSDLRVDASWSLHPRSRAFLEAQRAAGPEGGPAEIERMVRRFEQDLARDTVWNRDVLHARVHERFAQSGGMGLETTWVWLYSDLFATPASDPWLGLWQPDVYTGLPDAGLR